MKSPKELIQREADCGYLSEGKKPNTVRIGDVPGQTEVCRDSEHNLPSYIVYTPGTWQHTCPKCGKKIVFVVPNSTVKV